MCWRIVQQPDGLYARFSDVVQNFTHLGLSAMEVALLCRNSHKIPSDLIPPILDNAADPRLWDEALTLISEQHGREEVIEILREAGLAEPKTIPAAIMPLVSQISH